MTDEGTKRALDAVGCRQADCPASKEEPDGRVTGIARWTPAKGTEGRP